MNKIVPANQSNIVLRESEKTDTPFFERLYFETRREEFAGLGWDENQLAMLLKSQFDLQTRAYAMQFSDAKTFVIEVNSVKVGRFITSEDSREIRLIDIAVLSGSRRFGIGSFVMHKLQNEVRRTGKILTLQVLKTNFPAISLYEKFGFAVIGEDDLYMAMEWRNSSL